MHYLLDTHVLLWWFQNPSQITQSARDIISDGRNIVGVSSVCTWEIVIKRSLGKLEVPDTLFDLIGEEQFAEVPVTIAHTRRLASLPHHHNDPFDRLLIAQSIEEETPLITRDTTISGYPLETVEA